MIDPITGAPSPVETVTIGGQRLTLRFSTLAQFMLGEMHMDVSAFFTGLRENNLATFSGFMKMFAAMVAHNFVSLKPPQDPPTAAQWSAVLDDIPDDEERAAKTREICESVGRVLRAKIQASAAVRLQEPAPAQGPTPLN